MTKEKNHFDTMAIHFGSEEEQHQALNPPLYLTSTFTFKDIEQAEDTFNFRRKAYVYTRGGNPTINLFERRMAALEGGVDAVAFASGMAAISTTLLSLVKQGDTIIAHGNLYGSSFSMLQKLLPTYGVNTKFIDLTDSSNLEKALDATVKVVYFETPTNPSLDIIDIRKIVSVAKKAGIKVVVDNTFATPYLQQPLKHGVDVVVHSVTKYISGHGDLLGGVAVAVDPEYIINLKFNFMCELGSVMSPFDAWLLLRGLKTLSLRMERHETNAHQIVDFLNKHSEVERVIYPGLATHSGHAIAKQQMSGFGGIVSFELKGDVERAQRFIKKLQLIKLAVSLGDAETLVEIPALMTHKSYSDADLAKWNFSKKTIRIATGLEYAADIIRDIEKAIE